MLIHFHAPGHYSQTSIAGPLDKIHARKMNLNLLRRGTGINLQVKFQQSLPAIKNHINPRIDFLAAYPFIPWNPHMPFRRIASDEIVRLARQFRHPFGMGVRIRPNKFHFYYLIGREWSRN